MELKATAKYVRISPFKVRRTMDLIRNKSVNQALSVLFSMRNTCKAASIIEKTLKSALANVNNLDKSPDTDELFIKSITADNGPSAKRFRARARGRGVPIIKRTSHISVVVEDKNKV